MGMGIVLFVSVFTYPMTQLSQYGLMMDGIDWGRGLSINQYRPPRVITVKG